MKIKTVDLTKKYRIGPSEITAVDNVSFEVDEAKFIVIIGPSGSGKSTLLNLVGLNDSPTHGKVFIDDIDTSMLSNSSRRKIRLSRMGFVFQTFNLFPTLNSLENVEMPMSLAGVSRKQQNEKALTLLDAVGLHARASHRPKELSMGEMQRVAIARALANDPEVIIADEPTGELDSRTAKEIASLLFEIKRNEKTTVIVATHDEKVVDVAEEVYTIQDGKLKSEN
jgi:putative ABC transport system ATP-binding protein